MLDDRADLHQNPPQPRLIYRIHLDHGPAKGRREGFTETDCARQLDDAHQQLGGPVVLVWANLNTHVSRAMRELIATRLWLTVYQLPFVQAAWLGGS